MPVEIKELVIRAVARKPASEKESDPDKPEPFVPGPRSDHDDMVISECVRQVLAILRREKER